MAEHFGADVTFRQMSAFLGANDDDSLAELLLTYIRKCCRQYLRKAEFAGVDAYYIPDMEFAAFEKLWRGIRAFLSDPRNDPDDVSQEIHFGHLQRESWFRTTVHNAMVDVLRNEVIGDWGNETILPMGSPVGEDDDRSLHELTPDLRPTAEQQSEAFWALAEAMDRLFSLNAKPETLAVVAYALIESALYSKSTSEQTAQAVNGCTLAELRQRMGMILKSSGIRCEILRGFDALLQKPGNRKLVVSVTADKLNSRKSAIRKLLTFKNTDS